MPTNAQLRQFVLDARRDADLAEAAYEAAVKAALAPGSIDPMVIQKLAIARLKLKQITAEWNYRLRSQKE